MTSPSSISGEGNSITQIHYFSIPQTQDISMPGTPASQTWNEAIDVSERHPGFERCYWGRSLEKREEVELHIVRTTLQHHKSFLSSPLYADFLKTLSSLFPTSSLSTTSTTSQTAPRPVRHVLLRTFHPSSPFEPPFPKLAGTAIYLDTTAMWSEGAWPLWTHIVRDVPGCRGIVGGSIIYEQRVVEGEGKGTEAESKEAVRSGTSEKVDYLVYVAWNSVKEHEDYHHTKHFEKRKVVLGLGNRGFKEYGHVVFEGSREGTGSRERMGRSNL